jgi:hypothetical protein
MEGKDRGKGEKIEIGKWDWGEERDNAETQRKPRVAEKSGAHAERGWVSVLGCGFEDEPRSLRSVSHALRAGPRRSG